MSASDTDSAEVRLMAAAPNLLDALRLYMALDDELAVEGLIGSIGDDDAWALCRTVADRALAKALGIVPDTVKVSPVDWPAKWAEVFGK